MLIDTLFALKSKMKVKQQRYMLKLHPLVSDVSNFFAILHNSFLEYILEYGLNHLCYLQCNSYTQHIAKFTLH